MIRDFHTQLGDRGRLDAVVWDGALRGKHTAAITRDTGAVMIRPFNDSNTPREFLRITDCRCGVEHRLYTANHAISVRQVDGEGSITFQPLPIRQLRVRRNKNGTHRHYLDIQLPCGTTRHERIDQHADPGGSNRADNIQPPPPGTPEHARVYGWREDAESRHAELDANMRHKRMPYYKPDNQDLYMTAEAMLANAVPSTNGDNTSTTP